VVQAPTTLLAQVDAAIGGKTAVNLPEGKNLVGAFHQPLGVYADVATLATLPPREYRAGLGEVAKYALMPDGEGVAHVIDEQARAVVARDLDVLTDLVAACAAMKAHVVAADPHERTGLRATLNLGHTLGHALEAVGGYELLHGEAVAVGLVFAGALAGALERIDDDEVARYRNVVAALDLPTAVPAASSGAADRDGLLASMRRDKKSVGGLTFVLPGPLGLETVHDPDARALDAAFAAVGVGG
jgi:3-dehydroquinate synthetase